MWMVVPSSLFMQLKVSILHGETVVTRAIIAIDNSLHFFLTSKFASRVSNIMSIQIGANFFLTT